jgi:hypothetical protein
MNPVVKRIAVHATLTATILCVMGVFLANLADEWMSSTSATRPGSAAVNQPMDPALRYRIPLTMAAWGIVFVTGYELIRSRFRRRTMVLAPAPAVEDSTEKLLNELLAQADAKRATEEAETAVLTPPDPVLSCQETGIPKQDTGIGKYDLSHEGQPSA